MRRLFASVLLFLAACGETPDVTRVATVPATASAINSFAPMRARPSLRSNEEFARDFLRLAFELESGREMPALSRFSGPITVRMTGAGLRPVTSRDLDHLLERLRSEASLSVSRGKPAQAANINVELIDAGAMRRVAPHAACFVAPNARNWADFLKNRRSSASDWTALRVRQHMAIFIPSSSSPQEIRDCLHEEIAQALGPVNDLFDLPDSVFNDDNFHAILTGFDMEVLRVFYHPALKNGMTRNQVAARLPAVLRELRPNASVSPRRPDPGFTPPTWTDAISQALGAGSASSGQRVQSARWALDTARSMGWRDTRLGFSLYAYGRLNSLRNPDAALAAFAEADRLFSSLPDTEIHSAHIAVHSAAFALSSGRFDAAVGIVDQNLPAAMKGQNAGLLSTLLMIKSAALEAKGQTKAATRTRLDSLGWARYAFATEAEVQRRLGEINDMVPKWRRGGAT